MRHTLLMSIVIVMGCADGSEHAESLVLELNSGDPDQGVHILGLVPDAIASGPYFRVLPTPVNRTGFQLSVNAAGPGGVNGTHLVANDGAPPAEHVGADPWFVDLIMEDGAGGRLKILSVEPGINATLYYLEYKPTSSAPWGDYCSEAGGAIALAGYYDDRRIHQLGPWLSFACQDSAAHKCNRWGYVAGNAGAGDPSWDHHQACTAMANADYCRTGVPYTREGTRIQIRDYASAYASPPPDDIGFPLELPGDPDVYYFEAAWRPGSLTPICLSRVRWIGMPPMPCENDLPDPRFGSGQFCEDILDLQTRGAYLVSASKVMDAPLFRWRNPVTGDVVTTTRGYPVTGFQETPFPGYTEYLGTDSALLRNLPTTLLPGDMVPLHMQRDLVTGERVVATAVPLPGHVVEGFEAFAYPGPDTVPSPGPVHQIPLLELILCRIGLDYQATVAPPPGCAFVASLGYALPPP